MICRVMNENDMWLHTTLLECGITFTGNFPKRFSVCIQFCENHFVGVLLVSLAYCIFWFVMHTGSSVHHDVLAEHKSFSFVVPIRHYAEYR